MNLFLRVKKKWFAEIKSGRKIYEYRLKTPYWETRIVGKTFNEIIIVCGYPNHENYNENNYIRLPWKGYEIQTIRHEEFENDMQPIEVFAIRLVKPEGRAPGDER